MNKYYKRFGPYLFAMPVLFVVAVVLRTIALFRDFDAAYGYFDVKALFTASAVIAAVGAAGALACRFLLREKITLRPDFAGAIMYVPTAAASFGCGLLGVLLLRRGIDVLSGKAQGLKLLGDFSLLTAILALFTVVYLLLSAALPAGRSLLRGNFGMFAALFYGFYAATLYFDAALPVNAPNKLTDQMAYVFLAMFFLYETRVSLGRDRWHAYLGFGMAAALLSGYASVPALIYYFATGTCISNSVADTVFCFLSFVFVVVRLIQTASLPEDKDCGFVFAMRSAARSRAAAVPPTTASLKSEPLPALEEETDEDFVQETIALGEDAEDGENISFFDETPAEEAEETEAEVEETEAEVEETEAEVEETEAEVEETEAEAEETEAEAEETEAEVEKIEKTASEEEKTEENA